MSARRINGRAVRAVLLAMWAGFFIYLLMSGEMSRYLGPRTYWVVPFGAITLGGAAVAYLATLRRAPTVPPTRGDVVGFVALLIPIVAIAAVPQPDLGALAVSRKSVGGAGAVGAAAPLPTAGRDPSFIDVHFANQSDEYAATLGITEGTPIDLVGFVSRGDDPGQPFELARFYVSCCAADAIPYSVTVAPGDEAARYPINTWLEVRGVLSRTERGWLVVAEDARVVPEPDNPYLS